MKKNYVHAYIGEGKGKTTAATGLAVRALGAGMSVLFVSFLKHGSSEHAMLTRLGATLICPKIKKFVWQMNEAEKQETARLMEETARQAITASGEFDLIVLDEILGSWENGFISTELLRELCTMDAEIVLTGRRLPEEIREYCGYISKIACEAHPFDSEGTDARRGIEF